MQPYTAFAPAVLLPPQLLPKSQKTQDWKEATLDRLEQIGRRQLYDNLRLKENYEIIRGKFIWHHYFEAEGVRDMLGELTREFDIPRYLRHYDIISPVVNTLSGEYQKRPDNFRAKGYDEFTRNAYIRQKSQMLLSYVQQNITNEINQRLAQMGYDPARQDFPDQAAAQQYQQELDQQRQALTPPEIQKYMEWDWMDVAEMWSEHQLELDKQRFKLDELEKTEFEDMLVADRCFRHFFLTANSYCQESWNPMNTFYHKSPEINYVEDGDYVGRITFYTQADVIDRYGYLMTKQQLASLQAVTNWKSSPNNKGWNNGISPEGVPYGKLMPHANWPQEKLLTDTFGFNPANPYEIPFMDQTDWANFQAGTYSLNTRGYLLVVEAYWKSQRKLGKVTYFDPTTYQIASTFVDEDFVVPDYFKEVDANEPDPGVNTIQWTWINEVWKGIKINCRGTGMSEDLYLDVRPLEFQFRSGHELYGAKLPVCGQIFNARNAQSMSLVDMMKPHQIGHNVAMNQLYEIMQREIGRFFLMDVNLLPALKDWGGEKSFEKFMLVARSLGIGLVDSSPSNTKGASFNQFTDVDMDESARMMSRAKLAEFFEQRAMAQVGFNQQRLGEMQASETATTTQSALGQSYAQTESYFTNFSNYKRRCLEMNLMIAQYVQSHNRDVAVMYTKSDMSRAFIQLSGDDLVGRYWQVYVSKSAEDMRQLEMMRQFILNNNAVGLNAADALDVIRSYSPAELAAQLRYAQSQQEQKSQQEQQMQQQEMEQEREMKIEELRLKDEMNQRDNDTRKEVAYITTFGFNKDNTLDADNDQVPDMLEYQKFSAKVQADNAQLQFAREKQVHDQQNKIADRQLKGRQLALQQKELQVREDIANKQIEVAKLNKNKYDRKTPKKKG